jgi:hypothetical protein
MKEDFSKKFNGINFQFQRNYHTNTELWYYINFNDNGKNTSFKMYKGGRNVGDCCPNNSLNGLRKYKFNLTNLS